MGMTSLILREINLDENVKDCMTTVMTSALLLLTLINNLLGIRKLDANMLNEFVSSPIELEASLRDAVVFCRPCATVTSVGFNLNLAVISVSDQGAGLTGRDMPDIFEKFTQLDTHTTSTSSGGNCHRSCWWNWSWIESLCQGSYLGDK
jgi:signal transduction histidine kinase